MSDWRNDLSDDQLVELLRATVDDRAAAPASMLDMIMAGYDITNVDAFLAEVVEDVQLTEAAGLRATDGATRLITCGSDDLRFEFELRPIAPQVVGHLDPVVAGTLHLEQAEHAQAAELGDGADFEFTLRSSKPFRLRHRAADGTSVATEWILP